LKRIRIGKASWAFWSLIVLSLLIFVTLAWLWSATNFPGLAGAKTERFFLAMTAMGTVFLGMGTFWLGWETRRLGKEEAEDRRLGVRPTIVFLHSSELRGNRENLNVSLCNVGTGPAVDCRYAAVWHGGSESQESGGLFSFRFVLPTGGTITTESGRFRYNKLDSSDHKQRVNNLFGGTDIVEGWVKTHRSSEGFLREMVWCSDVLGGRWWFARTSDEGI
jgi:hypothetical protein